jgi:hypothetical protein
MSPLTHMQVYFISWNKLKLRLKKEIFIKEYFIDLAFVTHLLCCWRKDSNKQPAVHPIVQQPQRSKKLLDQMDFLDYLLYDVYSDHVTASESFVITNGYIWNSQHLQNQLGWALDLK